MFVLEGLGVDNCWIEIEGGNEVLLLDGLVWEWVEVIEEFGLFIVKDYVGFGSVWNVYVFDLFIIVYQGDLFVVVFLLFFMCFIYGIDFFYVLVIGLWWFCWILFGFSFYKYEVVLVCIFGIVE